MSENGSEKSSARIYDVRWQKITTEACEKEKKIRMKWFLQNRERLLDNLNRDDVGEVVRKKLKQLKEYHEHWRIEEPPEENLEVEEPESLPKEDVQINFMRPIDSSDLEILYKKGLASHEARKNYLKRRRDLKPEEKFYSAECTNWEYGWRLNDFPKTRPTKVGRRPIIEEDFYRKNASSLNRDTDLTRPVQATNINCYHDDP